MFGFLFKKKEPASAIQSCALVDIMREYGKAALADKNWKDRVIGNIDFFLNRIMKKNALADGE